MSKTDKTKPWRVRVAEHQPVAIHNHERGVCDLPPSPLEGRLGVYTSEHCSWSDWNICHKGNCCYGCGCRMCIDQFGRKRARRRERYKAKKQIRAEAAALS